MESWCLFNFISFVVVTAFFLKFLFSSKKPTLNLPPGPIKIPIIGTILCFTASLVEVEALARSLHAKFGPIFAVHIGSQPVICIADRHLAYKALIQKGSIFAIRPPTRGLRIVLSSNQHNINSGFYGSTWCLLRRNLISGILHPSRVKLYSQTRKHVLQILLRRLNSYEIKDYVFVLGDFQYAMFWLLAVMCFGDKLNEEQIEEIMKLERAMFLNSASVSVLNFWPILYKTIFHNRWLSVLQLRKSQEDYLIPLIRERKKMRDETNIEHVLTYVDTIQELQLPCDKRKLSEGELVTLCNEFLNAGTDTISTSLEWIMANLFKYPHIQEKLLTEIKGIVGDNAEEVREDDLGKLPYLKAVVLEGLRRHPPGHFLLPHAVTEDTTLDKYSIPKNANVNFMMVEMGWDSTVWDDLMVFKPERFMDSEEAFDITGSREIKMMPFGAGRRICPAYSLAMLHLEYFVANLVWNFEWKAMDGDDVDLSEKTEVTVAMKNPLKAKLSPRFKETMSSYG